MTLTIQDLGSLGEFFGSIAVLATLIYLALQTRQNTMAISAQLDAATVGTTQANIMSVATSSELAEAVREDMRADLHDQPNAAHFLFFRDFHLVPVAVQTSPTRTPSELRRSGDRSYCRPLHHHVPWLRELLGKREVELLARVRRVGRGATLEGGVTSTATARPTCWMSCCCEGRSRGCDGPRQTARAIAQQQPQFPLDLHLTEW